MTAVAAFCVFFLLWFLLGPFVVLGLAAVLSSRFVDALWRFIGKK